MSDPSPAANGNSRGLWALVAGRLVLAAGFSLSFPFIAIYLTAQRQFSPSWVGALFAASGICVCYGMLAGGELSDRLGPRRVMLMSLLGRTVFAFGYSLCIAANASFWVFALVHCWNSFLFGIYEPASQALVTDLSNERQRMEAFGLLRIGGNLGWAIGPMLGGFVAERSYALLFEASAGAYVVAAAMLVALVPAVRAARPHDRFRIPDLLNILRDRRFLQACGLAVLICMTMAQLVVGISMYCTQELSLAKREIGWLLSTNGLMVFVLQYPATLWMRRARLTTCLALGSLLYAVGYIQVGFARGFRDMFVAMLVITAGEIVTSPTMDALAANLSPARFRGRYRGVFSLAQQFGRVLGQALCGVVLAGLAGWRVAQWVVLASPAMLASLGYTVLRRDMSPMEERGEALPSVLPAEESA